MIAVPAGFACACIAAMSTAALVGQNPRLLRDIQPGSGGGLATHASWTSIGPRTFFRADDGQTGHEPWVTDGTTAGTARIADLTPGPLGNVTWLTAALGRTFVINMPNELWVTDGTRAGTQRLGAFVSIPVTPVPFAYGRFLLFAAEESSYGVEPWISDGTVGGPERETVCAIMNTATTTLPSRTAPTPRPSRRISPHPSSDRMLARPATISAGASP